MKKLIIISLVVLCGVVTGFSNKTTEIKPSSMDEPCFYSTSSVYYCAVSDMWMNGYSQGDGTYAYYIWQCPSWPCSW